MDGILEGEKLENLMNLVGLIFQARVVLFGLSGKPFYWYEHEALTGGDVHTVESMVIRREELTSAAKGTEPLTISTVEIDGQEAACFGMLAPVTSGEEVEYLLGVFDAAEELAIGPIKRKLLKYGRLIRYFFQKSMQSRDTKWFQDGKKQFIVLVDGRGRHRDSGSVCRLPDILDSTD